MANNTYWADRQARAQTKIANRSIKETEKLMTKIYQLTSQRVIKDFEATYDKLLNTIEDGRAPTPADLYKLDKYYEMQNELNFQLRKLGYMQKDLLSAQFYDVFEEFYNAINFSSMPEFNTISKENIIQLINSVWCADGKSWSARVWDNIADLTETLNEELMHCVVTGKKSSYLKKALQERFNVSFSAADSLVRTETAHIQTVAAQERYKSYGIQEVQVWADYDERRCKVCGKLHKTKHPINAAMPIPAHPRCRCTIIPVVE